MKKGLFIKTYGCQMNVYDSQKMADILEPLGYTLTDTPDGAHMILLNTCHIREKAAEKLYSDLGRLKPCKEATQATGEDVILAVAGCVAQAEGSEVIRRAPYVDMVFGPQTYHLLPQMIAQATRQKDKDIQGPGRGIVNIDFPEDVKFDYLPEVKSLQGPSAFLSIQEGCDKFCHFCVVPYTRGAEYSRPSRDLLKEAQNLISLGAREIVLLGQNVNAYHGLGEHGEEWDLGQLIRSMANLDGLERIRYTTSHPRDVNDHLVAVHGEVPQLMPYLHLPVQSGSNKILKAMNRGHTRETYLNQIESFRKACPHMAFSSDFIVGYPGETEEDFEETLRLVEEIKFAQAYSFKYSPRPGTPAASLDHQVPEDVKSERLKRLQDLLMAQQVSFNQGKIGQILPVLIEKKGRHEGQIIGRSPFLQSVHMEGSERLIGSTVHVMIKEAGLNSLTGEVVTNQYSSTSYSAA